MGRHHQGMDRPGVRKVPGGSGEQGKMEKTDCKIICGAPTTLAVKGLMMMMIPAAAAENFSSPELTYCADCVRSNPMLLQWHVKDPGHFAKSAGGRLR